MARKLAEFGHLAKAVERGALFGVGATVHALEREVAADQQTPLAGESRIEGGAERADGGHGHDAEGDAQNEDGEAAGAGAKLAQRDSQGERQARALCQ